MSDPFVIENLVMWACAFLFTRVPWLAEEGPGGGNVSMCYAAISSPPEAALAPSEATISGGETRTSGPPGSALPVTPSDPPTD